MAQMTINATTSTYISPNNIKHM